MFEHLTEKQQEMLRSLLQWIDEGKIGVIGAAVYERGGSITLGFPERKTHGRPEGWDSASSTDIEAFLSTGYLVEKARSGRQVQFHVNAPKIRQAIRQSEGATVQTVIAADRDYTPEGIQSSLSLFKEHFPDSNEIAFIMMRFGKTPEHARIVDVIKETLTQFGLVGVRADHHEYSDDLFANVMTYMHGCGFGIAVFEQLEVQEFNPNVALEVGYMMALGKRICLLKDVNLRFLHADLAGKLFREFDPVKPEDTIPDQLSKWLEDRII